MEFTVESVMAQAPDAASAKAAKGLAKPSGWPTLGYDERAVWGECQGSGSKPYQTQVDLSGPSFKCSCPSRKFPCKHGLALLLLHIQHENSFKKDEAPPIWVTQWLDARQQRAVKQEQKKEEKQAQAVDPVAATKREASRHKRMTAGLDELERWLGDLVQHGLAQLQGREEPWSGMAARMIDAQLPGMAARLQLLSGIVGRDPHWPEQLLAEMGLLQLLVEAWRRLELLSPAEQADVRTALGLASDKDEVIRDAQGLHDQWRVLGQSFDEDAHLWRRRVWLHGRKSERTALLLDFSHGGKRFEQSFMTGSVVEGTLAFYPSATPLRSVWIDTPTLLSASSTEMWPPPVCTLDQALQAMANTVAHNPWHTPLPMQVSDAVPIRTESRWYLRTDSDAALPMDLKTADGWQLLAQSGGKPLHVMGEWDGRRLRALSAWTQAISHQAAALVWIEEANA